MKLYHNALCSKSRGALELLVARGLEPEVVPYLEQPPSPEELRALLFILGVGARALLRVGEAKYQELHLDDPALCDDDLIEAMSMHPQLIERPILVHAGRAIIGRPPERILEIL